MNPLTPGLRQPDQRSCGAASVTMARALCDPSYAAGLPDQESFAREVLARHRELTSVRAGGRWQVPWPRALGTPPWAVARALTTITGRRHRTRLVRFRRDLGTPVVGGSTAVYVGDRWLPRHVTLVVDAQPLRLYDPARGHVVPVTDEQLRDRRLRVAGWSTAWFVVAPAVAEPATGGATP